MPYNIKSKCDLLNIMEYLSLGDLGRAIAAYKFYDLINAYNAAEYSFEEAQKQTSLHRKSYFLREAIVGFNSCYDYPYQVIYFAFEFFKKVESGKEYKDLIRNECKMSAWRKREDGNTVFMDSVFAEDIENLKQTNDDARSFFEDFERYLNFAFDNDWGIKHWANNIKHQGGFMPYDILKQDNVVYVNCFYNNIVTFTTEWLYPYSPSCDEIIRRLERQKENLVQFMDWLLNTIFGDTSVVDMKHKKRLFSANKCIQEIKSTLVVPIQVPEIK